MCQKIDSRNEKAQIDYADDVRDPIFMGQRDTKNK